LHAHKPDKVEIIFQGKSHGFLVPVDLQVNCQVKREPNQGLLPFMKKGEAI
jgi:hypothetical protein